MDYFVTQIITDSLVGTEKFVGKLAVAVTGDGKNKLPENTFDCTFIISVSGIAGIITFGGIFGIFQKLGKFGFKKQVEDTLDFLTENFCK